MNGTPLGFAETTRSTVFVVEESFTVCYRVHHGMLDVAVDRDDDSLVVTVHRSSPGGQSQLVGAAHVVPTVAKGRSRWRIYRKCWRDDTGAIYLRDRFLREIVAAVADRLWEGSGVPQRARKQSMWWTLPTPHGEPLRIAGW